MDARPNYGEEDLSLYARYFNGTPAEPTEVYCRNCQILKLSATTCPHRPLQKRARQDDLKPVWDELCKKYNYNDRRYSFGSSCRLPHKCLGLTPLPSTTDYRATMEVTRMEQNSFIACANELA